MDLEETLDRLVPSRPSRKIFAKVFDESTIKAVDYLANKGIIDKVEFVISTGKEAHVFRAVDNSGNFRAVKIYKKETSEFHSMTKYLEGDRRFKDVRNTKRDIVFAWTRKEHANLEKAREAGVRAPLPTGFRENVLVMEFIGTEGLAAPTLKEARGVDYQATYTTLIEFMARLLYLGELIHADLSEYNVLMEPNGPVVIDIGQGVLTTHPHAKEFFERDCHNVARYFSAKGIETDFEQVQAGIKEWKPRLK
ncbi:MAG: serine protein kinase RIO [Candidatus Diapherotrites archaeon]|nr:serine protein kinase RIO [Candidatus Diapherotrites archaeon]